MAKKDRLKVAAVILLYLLGMFYYCGFINNQSSSAGFGIPGADMLAHFRGAEALSRGYHWKDLAVIATRFEKIGISTIGYFLYTSFLSLAIFTFPVFSTGFNVYLVYVFQIVIAVDSSIRYNRIFSRLIPEQRKMSTFFCLATCIPYLVQACQLMRDIYYMWFIALLLEKIVLHFQAAKTSRIALRSNAVCTRPELLPAGLIFWGQIFILSVLCVCVRFYSLILIVPLMLYYSGHKKMGVVASLSVSVLLLVAFPLLNILKQAVGIAWAFSMPDFRECIQFLAFPNIFNQSKYLFNWTYYFGYTMDVGGCNVPGVYYAMAVWNLWFFPLAILGLITQVRNYGWENLLWSTILLNIVITYSVSYDTIDTRHKFFMSLPLCFLAQRGLVWLRKRNKTWIWMYNACMACLVLLILLFSWPG